ncbi:MAG: tetratricopeptide repeat protein [Myxococcales bacterium]|nr:tetratricopeptide repeat protein [Myxococcales bacterium]
MARALPALALFVTLLAAGGCNKAQSRALMKEGNALYKAGKLGAARAKFEEAAKLEPRFALAHLHIGYACIGLAAGRAKAEKQTLLLRGAKAFRRYMVLSPSDGRGARFYLKTLLDAGRTKEATTFLEAEHKKRPRDVSVVQSLGMVASKAGRFEDALRWYEKRAALEPRDPKARYLVGTLVWEHLYHKRGKVIGKTRVDIANRGIVALKKAIALQPSYVEAVTYVNLLLRERALGHDDEAAKKADVAEADKWHKRAQQMLAAQSSASARAADDDKKKKVGH